MERGRVRLSGKERRHRGPRGGFFSEAGTIPRIIKAGLTGGRCQAFGGSADRQRWTHSSNSWQRPVIIINHECQEAARWLSVGSRCREFSVSKARFGKGFRTASFPRTRRFRPANKFAELIRLLCAFHPSLSVERLMAFFCHILGLFRVSYLSSRKLEKEACKSSLPFFFFF